MGCHPRTTHGPETIRKPTSQYHSITLIRELQSGVVQSRRGEQSPSCTQFPERPCGRTAGCWRQSTWRVLILLVCRRELPARVFVFVFAPMYTPPPCCACSCRGTAPHAAAARRCRGRVPHAPAPSLLLLRCAAPRASCRCPCRAAATATCAACSARSATAAPMSPGSPPVTPPVLAQLPAGGCRLRLRLPPRCAPRDTAAARFLTAQAARRARPCPPAAADALRACAASAAAAPLLPSATAAARMSAPGAPVACSYLACDCAPPARPRAPAPRRSAVVLSVSNMGSRCRDPPVFAGLHGGAAVDTAAATAAAAACAVRCQPIVGAVAPPLPRLHASDHAAAGYRP